ncbi:MAG: transposase [Patescibacteria group bacterium]
MSYKIQKQYRYKGYDYREEGFYFVTICTKNREMFFGNVKGQYRDKYIKDAYLELSEIGKIAEKFWLKIPNHFSFAGLDKYIIMPNHVHGIIQIKQTPCRKRRNEPRSRDQNKNENKNEKRNEELPRSYAGKYPRMSEISPKAGSVSVIIGSFKSITKKIINKNYPNSRFSWQPRFHDRIIRNNDELNRIRQYIIDNPIKLAMDRNLPAGKAGNPENLYM